jgi:hypothetical protein
VALSQAQLAMLAQQNHALYAQVIKAYQTGSPLVVTQHEYRVLSRLSAAYLSSAKAGQPAPGAPGSPQNPISVGKTPTFQVPTSGPLVPWIQGMAQLATDLAAGAALFPPLAAASAVVLGIELVLIIVKDGNYSALDPSTPERKTITPDALRSMMCGFGYLALTVVD